jgi:2-amino-4-hydroxy-6-hydroxymethyldihydropteridine diphosphokinase
VGLGSNLGDSEALLAEARERLALLRETRVAAASALYVTAPVGGPDQPDYLNQVVELYTPLAAHELLGETQRIERELGRTREVRWGPRTIDIDILWYHGFSAAEPDLQIPHPRLEERRFVLEPLAELAPDLVLPSGQSVIEALRLLGAQTVRRYPETESDNF